jgi:hypothetical protein
MKYYLAFMFLGLLTLVGCSESSQSQLEIEKNLEHLEIDGQNIWAIYTHGETPATVDVAMFTLTNRFKNPIYPKFISLEKIMADVDSAGTISITSTASIDSLYCKKCDVNNIQLKSNYRQNLEVYFQTGLFEVSYKHNYQAIRLTLELNGDTLIGDAKVDVEQEAPTPKDLLRFI